MTQVIPQPFKQGYFSMFDKITRVLVYPNITYKKDLKKDSYVDVLAKMLKAMNKATNKYFFYILTPEVLDCFNYPNVKQIIYDLPSYPNQMRTHFDSEKLLDILPEDFDIIFSHLPEHTLQLTNLVFNKSGLRPIVIGYCHWFEFKGVAKYPKNLFYQNILGILEMKICYVNTEAQKQMVLEEASKLFNEGTIAQLSKIIQVFYLGAQQEDIVSRPNNESENIIVFNHRPDPYKHFDDFMDTMDELHKIRQDFKVWIPLLDKPNRDYVITDKFDNKKDYYKFLRRCRVGYAPKQKYAGWSVAALDGLMNGVPYIFYNAPYYTEKFYFCDLFKNQDHALSLLAWYLDNPCKAYVMACGHLVAVSGNLSFEQEIKKLLVEFDWAIDGLGKIPKDSDGLKKFVDVIKNKKVIIKKELLKELGWQGGIPFTYYKNSAMKHYDIYDYQGPESIYSYGADNEVLLQKNLF